ncbi:MAG TPA: hypothetical protein VKY92_22445, partial [Verrucomicrobiae bacterium]|nr:hypothetical protein [Verrucomicrobiae bacterium]
QQSTPPGESTPAHHFRPVEPTLQPARRSVGLILPAGLAAVALFSLLLLWELSKHGRTPSSPPDHSAVDVAARALPGESTAPSPVANPPRPLVEPGTARPSSNNSMAGSSSAPESSVTSAPGASAGTSVTNMVSTGSETNAAPPLEAAPPPLKLQSIVYSPRRASALINGRVLFVGDRIRDFKIAAIHSEEVVLIGPGRTNVLSLEP